MISEIIQPLFLLIIFIQLSITTSQNNDRVALLALKQTWKDTPLKWNDGSDPCGDWVGITCNNSRVTQIVLTSAGLTGGLPGDIGQLTELEYLDLSYNDLGGTLTTEITKLVKLTNLILIGCNLIGTIPSNIGNLASLTDLSLNNNRFTGTIPASVGKLNNLYWLDLSVNQLTGSLPVSPGLDMLTSAGHFHLGDNKLSGDIPPSLFNSDMKLIHLLLDNNHLTGKIPSTLGLVQSLDTIRLDRNSLSGDVPSNINNLTNVHEMYLSNNILTGLVPNLTGMEALYYLDLSNNTFAQSNVPLWFSTLPSLTTLKMQNTNLVGELPAALFSIPQLQNVDISNNLINGSLDISANPSKQLEHVNLQNNLITDFRQRSQYTTELILVNNPICAESGASNRFCVVPTDVTPTSYMSPRSNCKSSCGAHLIQSPNCRCAYPFTGHFFFKATAFSSVNNETIYDSLYDYLKSFFQADASFVDSLSLSNPTRDLNNYLVIKLEVFPNGKKSFDVNEIGSVSSALSQQTVKPNNDFNTYTFIAEIYILGPGVAKSNTGIIIGSIVGGCVLVVLLVIAGLYALRQKGRAERAVQQSQPFAHWDPAGGTGGVPQLKGARSFTFEELSKYTGKFSETSEIGAGGYGNVYKGSLPNGQLIAIKRARTGSTQGGLEFKTEIELLSRVHHKNVVGLIGFCFDQDEQMLVYEYIVNGTLKDILSGRSGIRLDWMRRLKIALGAARGLQYLHDLADPPIIHRDVKTNNILLDQRLVAKVADFGLSKPLSDDNMSHVTTQVKGTLGYMDPEYYMTQQVTEKSDVYSFGIVMLELITARNPIHKGRHIVREVKQVMNKNKELYNLHEVLDPTIGSGSQLKGLERFVDLSLKCVEERGNQRPSMSEVVKELEVIMTMVGLSPDNEPSPSTSATYEGAGKNNSDHPYSNETLFAYSGSFPHLKLDQK
ncbi:hypothetical protein QVD17_02444 [Tagetes erecta]|uniref:non-specific serine/threonine protein kinase n=1 Tax=Tagetes erecta TaxID=13708 RepID=A0AAD8LDY1_TARER|nr:hypothetical protein QVD17_02444 [Tagetes erecta]